MNKGKLIKSVLMLDVVMAVLFLGLGFWQREIWFILAGVISALSAIFQPIKRLDEFFQGCIRRRSVVRAR